MFENFKRPGGYPEPSRHKHWLWYRKKLTSYCQESYGTITDVRHDFHPPITMINYTDSFAPDDGYYETNTALIQYPILAAGPVKKSEGWFFGFQTHWKKLVKSEITIITSPFVLNVKVNCYLVHTDDGFMMIDTGRSSKRAVVEEEVTSAGCRPGNLKIILLTHGDFDHCGNAAYLSEKFGSRIAMHYDDSGMVTNGDMFWNRNRPNPVVRSIFGLFFKLSEADRFKPDIYVEDGTDLTEYGFAAQVLTIPGHSKGSIGFLNRKGDLFCGDLLTNIDKPALWSIIDDHAAAYASVERLKRIDINTVYPGHGRPFLMSQFIENQQTNQGTE